MVCGVLRLLGRGVTNYRAEVQTGYWAIVDVVMKEVCGYS